MNSKNLTVVRLFLNVRVPHALSPGICQKNDDRRVKKLRETGKFCRIGLLFVGEGDFVTVHYGLSGVESLTRPARNPLQQPA